MSKQVKIRRHEIPPGWSAEACDFANKLLQRKPHSRLGLNGPLEIKAHPWFDNYPWDKLDNKQLLAPFIPDQVDNFDVKVTNDAWKDEETDKMKESAILLRRDTVQDLFKGYYYDQSFEGFNFNIDDKIKSLAPTQKRTSHRSCQLSPKSTIINHNRSNSSKQRYSSNSKEPKIFKTKRDSHQVLQRYRPISRPNNNSNLGKNQSRNMINFKAPPKKVVLPKGPFHYRNESKKISQI